MPILPNFLVIGVAKAGTTALYHHLKAHPEVYMPSMKEPEFFLSDATSRGLPYKKKRVISRLEDYCALFEGVRDEKAIGEASPRYFHSPVAPALIQTLLPEARLIALLRHPVERAYSHCMDMMNSGAFAYRPFVPFFREKAQSVETWAQEPFACYGFRHSFYYESLRRYFDRFGREQIRVYLFEDFVAEPRAVLADVYRFLGVDAAFVPELGARYNPTHGIPKSTVLHNTVMRPNFVKSVAQRLLPARARRTVASLLLKSIRRPKPALSSAVREEFAAVYREDIVQVQALIGRDLSSWFS